MSQTQLNKITIIVTITDEHTIHVQGSNNYPAPRDSSSILLPRAQVVCIGRFYIYSTQSTNILHLLLILQHLLYLLSISDTT